MERFFVYIPEDGESYELESYIKDIKENKKIVLRSDGRYKV